LYFRRAVKTSLIIAALLVSGMIVWRGGEAQGQNSVLYWGKSGPEVTKVQALLNKWGYYTGPIDGYYSGKTFAAVQDFQRKNGLAPDGVVGPNTWAALGLPTVRQSAYGTYSSGASRGASDGDVVSLLARVIEGEAADESYTGKVAVGAVILNRTQSGAFPSSVAGVIYQPHAFESVTNGQYTRPLSDESIRAAQAALSGFDPTNGALFFWNPSKQVNAWVWSRQVLTQIGQHIFAR